MTGEDFAPTNALERALRASALDRTLTGRLLELLSVEEVIVPVRSPVSDDGSVALPVITMDGDDYIPVFTSETQLACAGHEGVPHVRMTGRALARSVQPGTALAINPQGELGLALPASSVDRLMADPDGVGPRRLPSGSKLMIGEPAREPVEALAQLSEAAQDLPDVAALHRAWVVVDGTGEPPFLAIGVALAPDAAPDVVIPRLAASARVDAALVNLDDDNTMAGWMREQASPFYRRSEP